MNKTIPRVVFSRLGERFYVVTRYSLRDTTSNPTRVYMVAHTKYDVTEDVLTAMDDRRRHLRHKRRAESGVGR